MTNGEKVYHASRRSPSGQLVLDTDSLTQRPEIVTTRQDATADFQIAVKNYNKVYPLNASSAQVDIYRGSVKIATINVPVVAGQETFTGWDVGVYNLNTGTFTLRNILTR
jgi:hypothetical protein